MTMHRKCLSGLRQGLLAGATLSAMLLGMAPADAKVGVAAAVNTDARGKAPGGKQQVITLGETVIFNEEIATDAKGLVQVLLLDGTTFTVGPNSRLTIDEFVYDPNSGDAEVVATLTKGTLRFIGGQTSRKPGGATIKTPVGTIGIRGAMVECSVESKNSALFSMIFGNEVRFTGAGGERAKIFKPGYTLVVTGTGGGGVGTKVRPRTQADASTFQTALAGKTGQNGGASDKPDDKHVADSGVPETNSGLPGTAEIPTSRPSPVKSTKIDEVEQVVAEIDIFTQQELQQQIKDKEQDDKPPVVGGDDKPPVIGGDDKPPVIGGDDKPPVDDGGGTPPTPKTAEIRLLTAPETYTSFGEWYGQAGERGLVGSNSVTDRNLTLVKKGGRLVSATAGIDLPDITGTIGDARLVRVDVTSGKSPDGALRGPGFAGAGDFAAYLLGINGDPTRPFYVITGTGTPDAALSRLFSGDHVREYSLTQDPIRPSPAPFWAPDLFGPLTNINSSNLYIVESNTQDSSGDDNFAKMFQSWVDIEGDGVDQKSAIGVLASDIASNSTGELAVEAARRGSFRYSSTLGPANMRGGVGTLSGPDGSHFFGANANNFVLGPLLDPADGFVDSLRPPNELTGDDADGYLGDGFFGTHHVADLVATTQQGSLSRTNRDRSGFMSGLVESSAEPDPYFVGSASGIGSFNASRPNFSLQTDTETNSVAAVGTVYDSEGWSLVADSYLLTFGATSTSGGASAFVDDDHFGALQNLDNGNTRLNTDDEPSIPNLAGDNPGSYIVSGRANPIPGYQHCTDCDFIDWGWWGTRVTTGGSDEAGNPTVRQDFVHMGTWVAGDITNPVDMPDNLSATYTGTALGTVTRDIAEGTRASYIARGDMSMSFDFGSREGTLAISNFDGQSVEGTVSGKDIGNQALFGGALSGVGDTAGRVDGAFVNDGEIPAAGVIGDFKFGRSGYRAGGTIAGRR